MAGADKIFDYNFFLNQFDTQGQGINDIYSNGLQGGNIGIRFSPRVAFRFRLRHSNNWTGVQSNWWFNGDPVLPPNSNQVAHQNNFLASAELAVSGPGAWQHTFSGYEYNHVQANSQAYVDPGREFFDSPFSNLSNYNRAGFEYQGTWTPRPWAQTTVGYTFEDENGFIHSELRPRHADSFLSATPRVALQQLPVRAGTSDWKRISALAGVGYVNNTSFGNKVVPRASVSFLLFRGNETFSGTRLRAGYSEGIKEPSFLQSFGISGTFPVLPNPNLQPEQNRSWEAGFEQGFWGNKLSLSAIYYDNQFHNQIEFQTNPVDFTSQYVNLNKSMAHGAEVELRGQISNHFSFTGAYTYTSTRIQEAPPLRSSFLRSPHQWSRRTTAAPSQASWHSAVHLRPPTLRCHCRRGRSRPPSRLRLSLRIHPAYLLRRWICACRSRRLVQHNASRHRLCECRQRAQRSLQRSAGISCAESQLSRGAPLPSRRRITTHHFALKHAP